MGYYTYFSGAAYKLEEVKSSRKPTNVFRELSDALEPHRSAAAAIIASNISDHEAVAQAKKIINAIGDMSYAMDDNGNATDQLKWYDYESDMLLISTLVPEYVIDISGIGEEYDDRWTAFYHNGRSRHVNQEIKPVFITEHLDFVYDLDQTPVLLRIRHNTTGAQNFQLVDVNKLTRKEWLDSGMEPMFHELLKSLSEYTLEVQVLTHHEAIFLQQSLQIERNTSYLPVPFEIESSHVVHYGLIFANKLTL